LRGRCTIAGPSERFVGVGLHSGRESWIQLYPTLYPGRGIIFRSQDSGAEISASAANVTSTNRSTTLGNGELRVETVEHLLSALYSTGITDVEIAFQGTELPIGDGSALPFVHLVENAGLTELGGVLDELTLEKEVVVSDGHGSVLTAVPSDSFWITAVLDYSDYSAIGAMAASYSGVDYKTLIAPARTYGFYHELDALKAAGLGLGVSYSNVIALENDGKPDARTPLRMNDELVRHKILDIIGDLSLSQKEIKIGIVALRPSHKLNVQLSRILLGQGEKSGVI